MIPLSLFVFVLVQSSMAHPDDPFADAVDPFAATYSENPSDPEDSDMEKRNGDFLRFGRSDANNYAYDDTGKCKKNADRKNDNFIRFGKNGKEFLRFGRDPNKALRNGEIYLRFGRSTEAEKKSRSKRSTAPDEYPKRKDAFLRFGRDPENASGAGREIRIPPDSPLVYLLAELLARKDARWQNVP